MKSIPFQNKQHFHGVMGGGVTNALNFCVVGTRVKYCVPVKTKDHDATVSALCCVEGDDRLRRIYSDNLDASV